MRRFQKVFTPILARKPWRGLANQQMKVFALPVLSLLLLSGCAEKRIAAPNPEAQIRESLGEFVKAALHEFTDELGSSTNPWEGAAERWEEPYVEASLLVLAAGEYARQDAFSEGLGYENHDPLILKPPTPRSFWLPLPAEGTYTFDISRITVRDENAEAVVLFTQHHDDGTHQGETVRYSLRHSGDSWKITNLVCTDGFNLKKYLLRPHFMEDVPVR